MIKINLLGEESAGTSDNRMWLAAYVGSAVLCVAVFVLMQMHVSGQITDLQDKTTQAESQLARIREKTKEVRDLEARKNELQSITLAIAVLKKSQEGPVKLLEDLNTAVPDKLWLREMACKDNVLRMDGIALTDEALVTFMRQLEKSEYFDRVDLIERTTVPLVQVNTLNTFDGSQSRSVVRGEREYVSQKLSEIRQEVERLGLQYSYGVPDTTLSKANVNDTSLKLSFDSSGRKRFVGGRPSVHAWESLEQVRGENYTMEAKIRLTPKSSNIEGIAASLQAPAPINTDKKPAGKAKAASKGE